MTKKLTPSEVKAHLSIIHRWPAADLDEALTIHEYLHEADKEFGDEHPKGLHDREEREWHRST